MKVLTAKLAGDKAQAPTESTAAPVPSPHDPASVPHGLVPVLHPPAGVVIYMPREKAAA